MLYRARSRRGGFTLIELLIVVAIIGLLAAIVIPNMLSAMQKAKQKRTMADERLVGTSFMAWLTDKGGGAAAGQTPLFSVGIYPLATLEEVANQLVPQYIQTVPRNDGWGTPFEYRFTTDVDAVGVMAIRSFGSDGAAEGATYTAGSFRPTEFAHDIIWADGYFVRWPSGSEFAATVP